MIPASPPRIIALTVVLLALGACKKSETASGTPGPDTIAVVPSKVQLISIDVGKHVDSTHRITEPATTFGPKDTMFVSVTTEGAENNAAIGTRWTKGADLVKEMFGTISAAGSAQAVTEFHIANPNGWPTGDYQVEVVLDGKTVGTKGLTVK
jgi:hypothetical protein